MTNNGFSNPSCDRDTRVSLPVDRLGYALNTLLSKIPSTVLSWKGVVCDNQNSHCSSQCISTTHYPQSTWPVHSGFWGTLHIGGGGGGGGGTRACSQTSRTKNGTLTISIPLWVTQIHPSPGDANPPSLDDVNAPLPLWVTLVYFHLFGWRMFKSTLLGWRILFPPS